MPLRAPGLLIALVLGLAGLATRSAAEPAPGATTVVEVRSYTLKPGTRAAFHERFVREALPLLRRWQVDVVANGPSLHDDASYYLIRAFPGVSERQRSEDAFYGSREWIDGPRAAVLADIAEYTTIVVAVDDGTLAALRRLGAQPSEVAVSTVPASADLATLASLNAEYIRSVQDSDAARFRELLADDFLCTQADGTLQDRAAFLAAVARPAAIAGLAVHDVEIRLLGDVAIVHARTTYTTTDGQPGQGRYTDVWARREGRWLAVAAHVTRR